MKITLKRINEEYLFECQNAQGNSILIDNTALGENAEGVSPMETVLMAVASCSAIDIVNILKKQRQTISSFAAEVEGERVQVDEAKPFKKIMVQFFLEGAVEPKKAERAASLSFEKFCSVSKTLEPNVEVSHLVFVNGIQV